ncbi:MAG TPA: SulP family inorganic anion transporter [Acidimicrobiales bacterium]|nr:SulP family inorganic anion transporter [Acidimicrobiales bacterium]
MTARALPVLPTLRRYKRSSFAPDLLAGLTLVAIAIPEQMATAHLANMPTVAGFYAFIAGSAAFAIFGRDPAMSVGADSTTAPVFAAGVAAVAATGTPGYEHLVSAVALVVGGLLLGVGALRLGWVADFLPLSVITGVLAGIGVEIVVKQLPTVLGLPGGGTTTVGRLREVVDQIGKTNGWALGIALGVLAVLVVVERVDRRLPAALFGVVGATALVAAAGLVRHGAHVVGGVHAQLPHIAWPAVELSKVGDVMGTAVTVAFLCIVQSSATVRASGPSRPGVAADAAASSSEGTNPRDFDIDLAAVGVGSLLAGFSGAFAVNASPPRTAVARSAGARSQLCSLVAVAAVIAVLAFATSLLKDLPEAALGAVLVFVAARLLRVGELLAIYQFGGFEFALALITIVVVVFVGIEQGVVAAALLAVAQRLRIAARPRDSVLGREPGTDHWVPSDIGAPTEQVPGILVYLLYVPLWYANCTHVVERVLDLVSKSSSPVHTLVLDATGMSDVDYTGAKALGQMVAELKSAGTEVVIARASHLVHRDLKQAGLLKVIAPDHWYSSVEEAVRARGGGVEA